MSQFQGKVKWFNNAIGYGFFCRDGGPDVFVHFGSIQREEYKMLNEGDTVSFEVVDGTMGPQAGQVVCVTEVKHHDARPRSVSDALSVNR